MEDGNEGQCDLTSKKCVPCEGGVPPMSDMEVRAALEKLPGWELEKNRIRRVFDFKDYYRTMAFVNAVAWLSHEENHHPHMEISYNQCRIFYMTHAINGLSENDLICAAKINAFFDG